jgi:hypothetical protein
MYSRKSFHTRPTSMHADVDRIKTRSELMTVAVAKDEQAVELTN